MSPAETTALNAFREEVRGELEALRREMAPAIALAAAFARIGDLIADTGRFIKWGVGVGSGTATIALVGRAFGLW